MKTSSFFIYLTVLLIFLLSVSGCNTGNQYNIIPLEGTWNFRIDSLVLGIEEKWYNKTFSDTIHLPGTTDEAGYGKKTTGSAYGNLTREYEYIGPAWYRRSIQIPASWAGKNVWLLLERVLWESLVYIDGIEISVLDALGTPHLHDLGNLEPGNHVLTIRINNDMIHNTGDKGHAYTDFTQSIWNGIVGRIELQAKDPVHIYNIKTFPKLSEDKLNIEMQIKATELIEKKFNVVFHIIEINSGKKVISSEEKITISDSKELLSISIPAENKLKPWDEFNPTVYKLICRLIQNNKIIDQYDLEFGFREVSHDGTRILVNNKPVFLRGNLDCVHFPLTGYPSCNVEDWERIFKIYKDYGLNHVRFHSWCPPEAAFQAADRLGIYIQAEVIWIDGWMSEDMTAKGRPEMNTKGHPAGLGFNASRDKFVVAEINRMIDTYGNHPSFIMFCIGNELGNSNFEVMQNWISRVKEKDPRRLYAASTARTITKSDDYSVTHHIPGVGRTRGLNGPQTDWDFEETYSQMNIPIIAHEIGQWPVYPLWSEIDKYTGVLKARNLEELKKLADRNGISGQDKDLHAASGALNQIMYKYEIESFLRTRSCAGVQLLSMQDYQGQGEALIGWLDCFWEDKGITTPEMFREHFNTTVPLLRINKFTWQRNDTIRGTAHLFHYGEKDIINGQCWYKIISGNNEVLDEGSFVANDYRRGTLTKLGNIVFKPGEDESAEKLTIRIGLYDTDYKNEWGIWVFPEKMANIKNHDILISTTFNKTVKEALKKGKKVLLVANNPGNQKNSVEANFYPLYWSLSWFPGQGKTNIGLLLKENHAAFKFFPTDFHSDWQWEAISKNAKGFILNELPSDYKPIAQPVDDFHRNNKTGSIFELKVGTGKLLVCGYPVQDKENPVARQLLYSLKHYMISDKFNPEQEAEIVYLEKMFMKSEGFLFTNAYCYDPYAIFIAQGIMAGEVTGTSVILQSRLTEKPVIDYNDISGKDGIARFEVDTSSDFTNPFRTSWEIADAENDYLVKIKIDNLKPRTLYYYHLEYGIVDTYTKYSDISSFSTLPGRDSEKEISLVVVTGMNYSKFYFGKNGTSQKPGNGMYSVTDKYLGYPALATIAGLEPDYFIGTGDNVYYDHPKQNRAKTKEEMRRKWHEQFVQPMLIELFSKVGTYWEKDDHDYRFNDCDTTGNEEPSHELGKKIFLEQLPVTDPENMNPKTYRTHRLNKHLQIWLTEGRDYRSPNKIPDEPGKTLWGNDQINWLKESLKQSNATFKLLISPTPLVGPDDSYKTDNHTNINGFRYERDQFFSWLKENEFINNNFFIICGDRHWQYHSIDPSGIEEFSCGALVDANSRAGRLPGDPKSTDPEATITQPYVQGEGQESGGFLHININVMENIPTLIFKFCDENGITLYQVRKLSKEFSFTN